MTYIIGELTNMYTNDIRQKFNKNKGIRTNRMPLFL